jgi:hypothetical protein
MQTAGERPLGSFFDQGEMLTVVFRHVDGAVLIADSRKIDRSISIVAESEETPERSNFSLKSEAMRI